MKLLVDQNLSPKLSGRLQDLFPGSAHVLEFHLDEAVDAVVWAFAEREGFTIVTKDDDFSEMSLLRGFPPKVLHIGLGNCSTKAVEALIRSHVSDLKIFEDDAERGILFLW